MASNSFGTLFRFTSFGESHGETIGCVVDGVPPKLPLAAKDIQKWLDLRKPGTSRFVSQRREEDKVRIVSGVFDGLTTGAPIAMLIDNTDTRSKDYDAIKNHYRPGHADYTYDAKYGIRDHRGGGRSSARETAARVAAGGVARLVLASRLPQLTIQGAVVAIGPHAIDRNNNNWDWEEVSKNPFWCPTATQVPIWESFLDEVRKKGTSTGAIIEITATHLPPGIGSPVYQKLDAVLASAMMSIPAVKGVEIGSGFALASMDGAVAGDAMRTSKNKNNKAEFTSNHSGGVLGGISSGQPLVVRFAVKPTSSIRLPRPSIDKHGKEVEVKTLGRHDPCVGIRAVPIGEAMMAVVLADLLLQHEAQCGSID
ncbi:MAG: chorismate synthase [Proteobacteria bacterium]|nr:chorismate synthase [Pseudomonadota bacterium]